MSVAGGLPRVGLCGVARDGLDVTGGTAGSPCWQVDDHWFLDRSRCDGLLRDLRSQDRCAAVLTPCAGAPDAIDRWDLVIFVERLTRPIDEVVSDARRIGAYRLTARRQDPPSPPR